MQSQISLRILSRILRDLRKPRTRHHDACGVDQTTLQSADRGGVDGVSHSEIVGMHDQEFCIARIPELLCQSLLRHLQRDPGGRSLRGSARKDGKKDRSQTRPARPSGPAAANVAELKLHEVTPLVKGKGWKKISSQWTA